MAKGWLKDADGWWWRNSRPTDPKIGTRTDLGFDDSTFPGSKPEGKVYLRRREDTLVFDQGRLPPEPNRIRRVR